MKLRTTIIIDFDIPTNNMNPNEFAELTQNQLTTGELYVDEFIEMSNNTTIVCVPIVNSDDS